MTGRLRLGVMSDLHNEFERPGPRRTPSAEHLALERARRAIPGHPATGPLLDGLRDAAVDLVVMAGDIDVGTAGIGYAARVSEFVGAPVVYVMGNHEAYGGDDIDGLVPALRREAAATDGRVRFLECEAATLEVGGGRLHVLGCTLFTDYRANGASPSAVAAAMHAAADGLLDHSLIVKGGALLTPRDALAIHLASRAWLGEEVARIRAADGPDARILVATHHAPVLEASAPEYRGNELSPAFVSDLSAEIAEWRPLAMVWGHTHHSTTGVLGETRLVSAQRGYVNSEPGAESFRPSVVDL